MKNKKDVIPVIPPKEIVTGNADAPVQLMMFGDYESEACAKLTHTIDGILEKYDGKVNMVFRHFPLTRVHQKAHKAAEAAIGAAQEGKFWPMHLLLYKYKHNLGIISLKSYAREAGVTDKKFLDHLINSDYGWFVQDDIKDGLGMGVTDIPVLFINGERLEVSPTAAHITEKIDQLLSVRGKVKGMRESKRA